MADGRSGILSQLKIVFGEKHVRHFHVRHFTDAIIVDKSALFRAGMSRVLTNTRFRVKATVASVAAIPESALRGKANAILLMGVDGSSETDLSNLSSLKSNYYIDSVEPTSCARFPRGCHML
jgi:hypothetical protein